jgi:hypothetical protein
VFSIIAIKRGALALLLGGTLVPVAGAQNVATATKPKPTDYCSGGLFTLSAGVAKFHISLDDLRSESPGLVRMRVIDREGTVMQTQDVWLRPGQSGTLEFSGSGLFRVQAEVFESATDLSGPRRAVGTAELFDVDNFRAVVPVICSPPDYGRNIPN